jgi:hypothetical protein
MRAKKLSGPAVSMADEAEWRDKDGASRFLQAHGYTPTGKISQAEIDKRVREKAGKAARKAYAKVMKQKSKWKA